MKSRFLFIIVSVMLLGTVPGVETNTVYAQYNMTTQRPVGQIRLSDGSTFSGNEVVSGNVRTQYYGMIIYSNGSFIQGYFDLIFTPYNDVPYNMSENGVAYNVRFQNGRIVSKQRISQSNTGGGYIGGGSVYNGGGGSSSSKTRCGGCHGNGRCQICGGSGYSSTGSKCSLCRGTGRCVSCHGNGWVR